jgi:hypothetical protein
MNTHIIGWWSFGTRLCQFSGWRTAPKLRIVHAYKITAYLGNHIFPDFFALPPLPLISSMQSPKLVDDLRTFNSTSS